MSDTPARPATSLRRRVADARATIVGTKVLRGKLAEQAAALKSLRGRTEDQQKKLAAQDKRVKDLEAKVAYLERARTLETVERERRDAQFGTLEVRLAELEQRLGEALPARSDDGAAAVDGDDLAAARRLVDEVRTEHERIRVRMQVVSAYEERLRRVEESVAKVYDGDPRHLV